MRACEPGAANIIYPPLHRRFWSELWTAAMFNFLKSRLAACLSVRRGHAGWSDWLAAVVEAGLRRAVIGFAVWGAVVILVCVAYDIQRVSPGAG